jgi:hypothetical protein
MTIPAQLPVPPVPNVAAMPDGNTAWAARYARTIQDVIDRQADRMPRTLQVHLGPSELGEVCDRQVVGKMAGLQSTNHVTSKWPAVVGTAVHALLAEFFARENLLNGYIRWVPEVKVSPVPEHPGTADLYDALEHAVVDHKILGPTSIDKIRRKGPSIQYRVQLLLYAKGYLNLGLPVDRVVLVAYPRTAPSLSQMYVWDHPLTPEDDILVNQVLSRTLLRAEIARRVMAGTMRIEEVPITPGDDNCKFCPFFRPESAWEIMQGRPPGPGCPGHSLRQ